jgi:hypothetical protein
VRWTTCQNMGRPKMGVKGLPGKRVELYLAGIIAIHGCDKTIGDLLRQKSEIVIS